MVNGVGADSFAVAMFSLLSARSAALAQQQAVLALLQSAELVQQASGQAVAELSDASGIDIYV